MTKKDLLDIENTMTEDDEEISLYTLAEMKGIFILDTFTRATLEKLGFDLSTVSEETLYRMAYKAEFDTERLMFLCEYADIPQRPDEGKGEDSPLKQKGDRCQRITLLSVQHLYSCSRVVRER